MQYIDKSILQQQGNQIIDELLGECWSDDNNSYLNADYSTLSKEPFRTNFKRVLLEEQQEMCCYCMKKLDNNHSTTLEHIIPHHASQEDFNTYIHTNFQNNVIHLNNFDRGLKDIPPHRYPHDIAYHNLIASCDSNTHCNHGRGNKPINPLIYDSMINTKMEYDGQGYVYSDEYLDDLEALKISVDSNLILYRWIWAELSKQAISPAQLTDDTIQDVILNMDYPNNFSKVIENFFDSPSKKPELLKYSWFYDYYREKRNNS